MGLGRQVALVLQCLVSFGNEYSVVVPAVGGNGSTVTPVDGDNTDFAVLVGGRNTGVCLR